MERGWFVWPWEFLLLDRLADAGQSREIIFVEQRGRGLGLYIHTQGERLAVRILEELGVALEAEPVEDEDIGVVFLGLVEQAENTPDPVTDCLYGQSCPEREPGIASSRIGPGKASREGGRESAAMDAATGGFE